MHPRFIVSIIWAGSVACAAPGTEPTTESTTSPSSTGTADDATGTSSGESTVSTTSSTSSSTTSSDSSSASTTASSTGADTSGDVSSSTTETSGSVGDPATGSSDGPPPDCAALADCESCGEQDGCGWCGATGVCSAGDELGPSDAACNGGWEADGDFFSCPAANCFAQTNCGDCQDAFSGCGWCASNDTCMPGAPDVPAPGGECADQQWFFDICPEDCAGEMTCVSCTGTNGCGWCGASSSCTAGTDVGPLVGACAGGWSVDVDPCF